MKTHNRTRWVSSTILCLAAVAALGCNSDRLEVIDLSNEGASDEQAFGTLRVPLVTPVQNQYRLRAAVFDITRGFVSVVTLDSEVDPDAESLDTELAQGFYEINLREGWQLEELTPGGAVPVSAALVTQNPQSFEVRNAQVTDVVYTFTTDAGTVTFGRGAVSVSVQVTPPETLPPCDLLSPFSCPFGQTCLLADNEGRTFCAESGSLNVGEPCSSEQCVAGAQCLALDSSQPDQKVCTQFCDARFPQFGCDCQALVAPEGVGVCTPSDAGDVFAFSGIANDLPISSLTGWSLCHADSFGASTFIGDILAACGSGQLMLACRLSGSDILQVAAHAPAADVTFDTGFENTPHVANGVGWYFNNEASWGFAPEGAPIERNSCDTVSSDIGSQQFGDGHQRLCFHTGGGALQPGWRCGNDTFLGDGFERLVFSAPL